MRVFVFLKMQKKTKRKNEKKPKVFFFYRRGNVLSFSFSLAVSLFSSHLPPPPTGACIVKSYSIVGITDAMNLRKSTR